MGMLYLALLHPIISLRFRASTISIEWTVFLLYKEAICELQWFHQKGLPSSVDACNIKWAIIYFCENSLAFISLKNVKPVDCKIA